MIASAEFLLKHCRAVLVRFSFLGPWDLAAALALRKLTAPPSPAASTRGGLAHLPRASTRDIVSGRLRTMSEDSRLRKLLAAALVELLAPERFAEILARHDDLYKPPEPAPFAEEDDNAQAAAVDAVPEVAEPREPADPPAILCRPAAAAPRRRSLLCRGYAAAAAAAAQRRRRRKTDGGRCVFSTARPGTPARTSGERCVFCSPQRMLLATRRAVPLQHVKADLRKLERKASWVHDRAHERLRRHLPRSEYKKVLTPKHCCRGHGKDLCVFSCRLPGAPARVSALDSFCIWRDPDRLAAAQMRGEHGVATQLRFFREHCPEAYAKADRTLRDLFGDDYTQ